MSPILVSGVIIPAILLWQVDYYWSEGMPVSLLLLKLVPSLIGLAWVWKGCGATVTVLIYPPLQHLLDS
jgi:hypothetical protein